MSMSAVKHENKTFTREEWYAEGERLFGDDKSKWKFKCPACGYVQSAIDYHKAGAPRDAIAFSCVGRWIKGSREIPGIGAGPCNYAGGGFFSFNPVTVSAEGKETKVFDFARTEEKT